MPGFLEDYGAGDARREKVTKRVALAVLLAIIAAVALYLAMRNHAENRKVEEFLDLLRKQDYQGAYVLWGPSKDYPFEKFNEDWGPASGHAEPRIVKSWRESFSQSCRNGVIYSIAFAKGEPVTLWVDRKDHAITFAPWPVCNPVAP